MTAKKGVPQNHPLGIPPPGRTAAEKERHRAAIKKLLEGLPHTDAVTHRAESPAERIQQLEATIAVYEREAAAQGQLEHDIAEHIERLRLELLQTLRSLAPDAKRQAKRGKPALLRLIGRTLRNVR